MAQRTIDTSARLRLVFTGDPAFAKTKPTPMGEWSARLATAEDAGLGATIYVIRPLNGTERDEAAVRARRIVRDDEGAIVQSVWDLEVVECLRMGLQQVEGDSRPLDLIIDTMPRRVRVSLGSAVVLASDLPVDPFAQPASA